MPENRTLERKIRALEINGNIPAWGKIAAPKWYGYNIPYTNDLMVFRRVMKFEASKRL